MKLFTNEIIKYYHKLISTDNFAFSKYADGEWMAINSNFGSPGNGEWIISDDTMHSIEELKKSFCFIDDGYHVGISCPCCQGEEHYRMKEYCAQPEENLTFANLFVNANYQFYINYFIPEFINRDVVLVANKNSNINNLPFNIKKNDFFGVGYNAWVNDLNVLEKINDRNYKNKLILFSCGPLGNILAYNLWNKNKNNTYIDIGSTLDKWLHNDYKNPRLYTNSNMIYAKRICHWGY